MRLVFYFFLIIKKFGIGKNNLTFKKAGLKKSKSPYPPMQLKIKGIGLARWFYFMNRTVLSPEKYLRKDKKGNEKMSKLKSLGFPFPKKKEYDWKTKYNELKSMFEKYGGSPKFNRKTDNRYVTWTDKDTLKKLKFSDGGDVKGWYYKQLERYHSGLMKKNFPHRITLLEKLKNWNWGK